MTRTPSRSYHSRMCAGVSSSTITPTSTWRTSGCVAFRMEHTLTRHVRVRLCAGASGHCDGPSPVLDMPRHHASRRANGSDRTFHVAFVHRADDHCCKLEAAVACPRRPDASEAPEAVGRASSAWGVLPAASAAAPRREKLVASRSRTARSATRPLPEHLLIRAIKGLSACFSACFVRGWRPRVGGSCSGGGGCCC